MVDRVSVDLTYQSLQDSGPSRWTAHYLINPWYLNLSLFPLPLFNALYVPVNEWQFGHIWSRFSGLLLVELPSMCSTSSMTLFIQELFW